MRPVAQLSASLVVAAVIGVTANSAEAQNAAGTLSPRFEVASIKLVDPGRAPQSPAQPVRGFSGEGGRVDLPPYNLTYLISLAFGVKPFQIKCPSWLETRFFQVAATAPAGASKDQIPAMLQNLLTDRFGMIFHRETHTSPVYALVLSSHGLKLKPGIPDDHPDDLGQIGASTRTSGPGGLVTRASARTAFGIYHLASANGVLHYDFQNITMRALAEYLTAGGRGAFDLPIIDMTELIGGYQVTVELLLAEAHRSSGMPSVDPAVDPPGALARESLEKQGLRLLRREAPIEMIIIDHMDKTPTEN